jgi:alpha-glucosidase
MHSAEKSGWWQDAAIYQIYPRSFADSNGDGDGDLPGIISHLEYLQELGIDAIWLSPFYSTPNRDGGYDISNPRDVDEKFGNLNDVKILITEAHKKDIKIIFDIVPNHFSSEHQWFKDALNSEPGSKERSRFHFLPGKGENGELPPCNWNSLFGGPAWTQVPGKNGKSGEWYLHLFDSSQPDLNWENQDIKEDFEKTLRFWLDLGVDGFRIDVAHGLVKDKFIDHRNPAKLSAALRVDSIDVSKAERIDYLSDMPFFDQEGVHEIYKSWRKILDSYEPERMSVAEVFVYPANRIARYVRPGELHQAFNFDFLLVDWDKQSIINAITNSIDVLSEVGAQPTWALDNHDSPRVVSRLKSKHKAVALALIEMALPGSIYIFQGEELGLPDGILENSERRDPVFWRTQGKDLGRDGARVPIPWQDDEINYGFSTGSPWLPLRAEYKPLAVNLQLKDSNSTLNLYRKALKLRKVYFASNNKEEISYLDSDKDILHFARGDMEVISNLSSEKKMLSLQNNFEIVISSDFSQILDGKIVMAPNSTTWIKKI